MAEDEATKKKRSEDEEPSEASSGGKRKLILLIVGAILLLGIGIGAGFFVGNMTADDPDSAESAEVDEEEEEEDSDRKKKDDRHNIYITVGKLLAAVEHNGSTRYIQAEVDLVGYEKSVMDDAQHNVPALRNRLLLLFSSQNFDDVRTIAGRERLRVESLKAVNDVLELGPKGDRVEDVYFTAFVIQ
ncbi:MAG: flagellar basal body protein FliL [Halieaceae bacterium]|nr:flagellar basal body protein FliL [Halieaceae bacterium]MBT6332806.1 flagellar basal body protein FliL [Halieaceae bacterium]MDG2493195.1 flagellar basal body-associated FliL family protein [Luminiphilus sp.]